ncbi:MAG: nitroreductase family protein, partial [candidate division Zixibacteria bacterium]|nr:nitroreductase family protein [candidate division Zixibacteria bacterium]
MSGILFLKTRMLEELKNFYIQRIGCELWLDQGDCLIFRHHNFLFGFCRRDEVENKAMLTFFYESRDEIDRMYDRLKESAMNKPALNEKYHIYQFFALDPENRPVEFQYFDHAVSEYMTGDKLLLSRRSIRKFENRTIPDDLLDKVFEFSRWAPTARNTQPYYFKIIKDRAVLEFLSQTRGDSTKPIGNAPLAVAICADPNVSNRYIQDGCIAAYHFILAAWFYGLGTCWIAA